MKYTLIYIFALIALVFFAGCKEDEYVYPSVKLDFLNVEADATGNIALLHLDNGETIRVEKDRTGSRINPFDVRRIICYYEGTEVYSLSQILVDSLRSEREIEGGLKQDPLGVRSVWLPGKYLNLTLWINTLGSNRHTFSFVKERVVVEEGQKTYHIVLHHNRYNDPIGYTQIAYMSVDLSKEIEESPDGFDLVIRIATEKEGEQSYRRSYRPIER